MSVFVIQPTRAAGDAFLDGLGETSLIARYLLDGNLNDWSRNNLHAEMEMGEARFAEDGQFGQVLALSADACVQIPRQVLHARESLSITGWVRLTRAVPGQMLFDFGRDKAHRFCCTLITGEDGSTLSVALIDGERTVQLQAQPERGTVGRWVHLAVVLDSAKQALSLFVDGRLVASEEDVDITLGDVMGGADAQSSRLRIGGSLYGDSGLNAYLHDVRFYLIALDERQVAVIHHNAISDDKWGDERPATDVTEGYRLDHSRQLIVGLQGVADIAVETTVGQLPHLPAYLPGHYADDAEGPRVRVIWPAAKDTQQVLRAGTYKVSAQVPGTDFRPVATVTVVAEQDSVYPEEPVLESFGMGQVALDTYPDGTPTPFISHRDKFIQGLAKTNPDTFLYNFRDAFGQPQPGGAEPLYGWDSQTCRLRGHASGHYLTAIAQAYASTSYDPELHTVFKQQMEHMVAELYRLSRLSGKPASPDGSQMADPTQVPPAKGRDGYDSDLSKEGIRTDYWNWGEGFISAYPPDQFIMLEHGASYGASNDQVWAPYYTLHKILAGLMDCYEVGEMPEALEVAKGMGLWVYERLSEVSPETRVKMWNSYIAGEYGGMNEAMARLSRLTGDERFLACAKLFDNTEFFFGDAERSGGLLRNVDTVRGKHANQHIPQITGALEVYRDTSDADYYRVVRNFWDICTNSYMYSIGGVAGARTPNNAECFTAEPDTLFRNGLSDGGQNETCATYNLLKLGRQLFQYEPDADYMDYYERALYNHILASVAEHDAGNTYHVPLNPGAVKSFGNAEMNSFTCCNGTALESATKLQNTIYLKAADDSALYVNLFVPSTLNWQSRSVKVVQHTRYPYADRSKLTIEGSGDFAIKIRVPAWVEQGLSIKVNDEAQAIDAAAGSYVSIDRTWRSGDTIDIRVPMDFHLMPLMDQPNIASIFYGPVLLAAEESGPRTDWRTVEFDSSHPSLSFTGERGALRFEAGGAHFKPFFETFGHHSVYVNVTSPKNGDEYPEVAAIDPPEKEFFAKVLDFYGIPIKSSAAVDDKALRIAYEKLSMMLADLPEARVKLAKAGAELHIIGRNEVTTDLPEFRDMKGVKIPQYGGQTYDERTRGLGGLMTSCGEENLLKLSNDRYRGSDICVHEFSHNVLDNGSNPLVAKLFEEQRKRSLAKGLWVNSYAGSNGSEFFAELAMWYFGAHGDRRMDGSAPATGRDGLRQYDPEAYALVERFWSGALSESFKNE